jgi:hypothetical protein
MGTYTVTSLYDAKGQLTQRSSAPDMPNSFRPKVEQIERGEPGVRIEDRGAEGVFLVEDMTTMAPDGKLHKVVAASRIDSIRDAETRAKGGVVWFDAYVAKSPKPQ